MGTNNYSLGWMIGLSVIGSMQIAGNAYAFTAAQADEGRAAYERYCAECHHTSLHGSAHGAPLVGETYALRWGSVGTVDLARYVHAAMSKTVPASTEDKVFSEIAAYIQQSNGMQPDGSPAPAPTFLPAAAGVDAAAREMERVARGAAWNNRKTPPLSPVTDAMLRNPPDGDWLSWRGTQNGQGYSPLKQINRTSISKLKLAWAMTMREGSNQGTPLVHDGIMYLTHPGNLVQAIDAATGSLIWEFAYPYPAAARTVGGPTRNIAIYKDKIFLGTYDAAIVALDARSGKQLWRVVQADYTKGYTHSIGPVIADGVVVSGINGCEHFHNDGCFITGHDPDTGRELWRTSTIALPGDPNDATWAGVPPERRAGSDNWIPGSYDPDLGLYFVGTAQAKPWVAVSRGMSPLDAALYTDSTLALDPHTGKMKWYFQHVPGDTLDIDAVFERVLVDIGSRKYVLTIGKDAILWRLDRRTGKFSGLVETLPQNVFAHVDHKTGRLGYRQEILDAKLGDHMSSCPGSFGGHNWQASAYSPATRSLIIPLHQLCAEVTGVTVDPKDGGFGGQMSFVPMPGTGGMLGRLSSYDVASLKLRWSHTQRAMFMTGVLTTGGGLAFVGDVDRYFKAFDVRSGKVLWQTRLGAPVHGYPITYSAGGRQYIAVTTGMGVFKIVTAQQSPDIYQPNGGNELYVFELAE